MKTKEDIFALLLKEDYYSIEYTHTKPGTRYTHYALCLLELYNAGLLEIYEDPEGYIWKCSIPVGLDGEFKEYFPDNAVEYFVQDELIPSNTIRHVTNDEYCGEIEKLFRHILAQQQHSAKIVEQ